MSKACSQFVLKCQYLARKGRPDILWSVNKRAPAVTTWTRPCDKRLARLIYIQNMSNHRQYCHVGNTQHNTVDWDCSKPREEIYVSVEVEHLFPQYGCVRNGLQSHTVPLNLKLFLWMLVCAWMVFALLIFGIW